jgi:hypothetical protein
VKRLTQFLIALVMMIQGMQLAVAGVISTGSTPDEKLKLARQRFINSYILAIGQDKLPRSFAKAQIKGSMTRPRIARVLPLSKAGGLVHATWQPVPDATEAEKGLPAGTQMLVSSESSKLTKGQRKYLETTPKLTKRLFPVSQNGVISPDWQARVHFQAGEKLNLSGRVAPSVRGRSWVVIEESSLLSDGTTGPWYTKFSLVPDKEGRFSQDYVVKSGVEVVRTRLLVRGGKSSNLLKTASFNMTSTPVPTSDMPFNTFGITTPPWQVANNQGFDNNGNYYASDWEAGSTPNPEDGTPIVWQGISFPIGPVPTENSQVGGSKGPKNVVHAAGQTINVPAGSFDWLYLAGAGANGNQLSQPFTLNFTDGSTETWTQSFTDWTNNGNSQYPTMLAGETVIREQSYRINQLGNNVVASTYTYGYTHHIPSGKTLASLTLPKNGNLGILSVVASQDPPIGGVGAEVKSYVLGDTNLTGTDLVTMKINNQQSQPLTFSVANWPQGGCNPTTSTTPCTYSTAQVTVNQNQSKTVAYVAPSSWNNIGFSAQNAGDVCVGPNCSTYIPDWSAGVNGTSCSTLNPTLGQSMAAGQTWTMTVQSQFTGYNGFLDSPQVSNMPASQNSDKYPNGCVFAMNTAFQNWLAGQPGWAKWLEVAVGVAAIVGISFLTFGAPEDAAAVIAADATEEVATDAALDVVVENEAGYVGGWYNDWGILDVKAWTGEGAGWLPGWEYGQPFGLNYVPII